MQPQDMTIGQELEGTNGGGEQSSTFFYNTSYETSSHQFHYQYRVPDQDFGNWPLSNNWSPFPNSQNAGGVYCVDC